jgi:hypothetical protein
MNFQLNFLQNAIGYAVSGGVSVNTILLLLFLPIVATLIAAVRQIVGVRGFGIFLPAALAFSFVAIGPVLGVFLFVVTVSISTLVRFITRKLKLRLQYLPRMATILWFVAMGVLTILFIRPHDVSIFPVLVIALLTEDFTRIQLGKSFKTAFTLSFQTIVLATLSYLLITNTFFQNLVWMNPEITLLVTLSINILLARFIGLRFTEYLRFRKLLNSK